MTKPIKKHSVHQTESKEDDSIDIINLLKILWNGRKLIVKTVIFFVVFGLLISFFSEDKYKASTTIVAQSAKKGGGSLSGLAALAGVNLSGTGGESSISPQLYPQIISNVSFQKKMLETLITIKGVDNKITYKKYYTDVYRLSVLGFFKRYTIGLPSFIISLLKDKELVTKEGGKEKSLIHISSEEKKLIDLLSNQLSIDINEKDGYITLSATMPEALAVAEFTKKAQELLEQYVIDFKIEKSISQLDFIKKRYLEKEIDFQKAQEKLALYTDQNQNVKSARAKTQLMKLQSEYELAFGLYSELAKQLESQEIKVKEDTPIFTIIEPVFVPTNKANPRKSMILIISAFLGFFFSIGFLLLKEPIRKIFKEINIKN